MLQIRKRSERVFVALFAALLIAAPATHAMKLKHQNLAQLISDAESIVAGTVSSVTDGVDAKGMPYTEITIAVAKTAKGPLAEGEDYTFRQFGLLKPRKMENGKTLLAVTPEGFPRWAKGEQVLAFLYKPASVTGLQTTAGMAMGKFNVANGKAFNEFDNFRLFDGLEIPEHMLSDAERAMLESDGAVDAATFMSFVGRAISEDWIAKGVMK